VWSLSAPLTSDPENLLGADPENLGVFLQGRPACQPRARRRAEWKGHARGGAAAPIRGAGWIPCRGNFKGGHQHRSPMVSEGGTPLQKEQLLRQKAEGPRKSSTRPTASCVGAACPGGCVCQEPDSRQQTAEGCKAAKRGRATTGHLPLPQRTCPPRIWRGVGGPSVVRWWSVSVGWLMGAARCALAGRYIQELPEHRALRHCASWLLSCQLTGCQRTNLLLAAGCRPALGLGLGANLGLGWGWGLGHDLVVWSNSIE
jgi:hypothetical protein